MFTYRANVLRGSDVQKEKLKLLMRREKKFMVLCATCLHTHYICKGVVIEKIFRAWIMEGG